MKLAEISSASQFLALDQAALGEDFMVGSGNLYNSYHYLPF